MPMNFSLDSFLFLLLKYSAFPFQVQGGGTWIHPDEKLKARSNDISRLCNGLRTRGPEQRTCNVVA